MPNGTKRLGNNFNMDKDTSMNKKIVIGTLMGCLFGATVGYSASVINVPHTFTAGTSIKASEVNANFVALSQRISDINIKSGVNFNRSSSFSEDNITPVSASIGTIVTSGSKSYIIKEIAAIEDPMTGKIYTVKYPVVKVGSSEGDIEFTLNNCQDRGFIVKAGVVNGVNVYISLLEFSRITNGNQSANLTGEIYSSMYIQVGNLCGKTSIDYTAMLNNQAVSGMVDRAAELMKYIVVQGG